MPAGAIYVGRPSAYGNPFQLKGDWIVWAAVALGFKGNGAGRTRAALWLYRAWLTGQFAMPKTRKPSMGAIEYGNGQIVETADHLQGLAGFMVASLDAPKLPERKPSLEALRGRDLACWCPPSHACHADILLELANQ